MKKSLTRYGLLSLFIVLATLGCKKKDSSNNNASSTDNFHNAIYVACQGQFQHGNSGVTLYNRSTKNVINNVYATQNNNVALGDICQSLTRIGANIYCVINNSNKIEIVDTSKFQHVATVTGLSQPRYMVAVNSNIAYISEWINNDIAVLNLQTNTITQHIPVGNSPEHIFIVGNYAFVANSGAYANDSSVSVINTSTNTVVQTIPTGVNPTDFAQDANGNLWIYCAGQYTSTTNYENGELLCVNPTTYATVKSVPLPFYDYNAPYICFDNTHTNLYVCGNNDIYVQNISVNTFSNQVLVARSFYGIGVDPTTNILYTANAGNNTSNGFVIRYTNTGQVVDSFQCGIVPGNFLF